MAIAGTKVAIIGGSIAGCATAQALIRAGCNVSVFERTPASLSDRGAGIVVPLPLRDQLIEAGYLPTDYAHCVMGERWWQHHDGSAGGRRLWTQPSAGVTNNWSMLWRALRSGVTDDVYHGGVALREFSDQGESVSVTLSDGTTRHFDALIGADGYRSAIRAKLHPEARAVPAGYVLWRGNYAESELVDRSLLGEADRTSAWLTVTFPGGHGVLYMIPDFEGKGRRVNWAIYSRPPQALGGDGVTSVPPGGVSAEVYQTLERLLADHFPPRIAALVQHSARRNVSIQPIYDGMIDSYGQNRVALVGDAGTMTRPHTGSGATKALQDVLALEDCIAGHTDWPAALADYDTRRAAANNTLVELGRRIGRAQVEETPDWAAMTPTDFADWTQATLDGTSLYFYEKA